MSLHAALPVEPLERELDLGRRRARHPLRQTGRPARENRRVVGVLGRKPDRRGRLRGKTIAELRGDLVARWSAHSIPRVRFRC